MSLIGLLWLIVLSPGLVASPQAGSDAVDPLLEEARAAFEDGRMEKALESYEAVLALDPSNRSALEMAGYIYYKAMLLDDAERLFHRLRILDDRSFHALLNLGNIALVRLDPIRAKDFYEKAIEQRPGDDTVRQNLRLCEERIARGQRLAAQYGRTSVVFLIGAVLGSVLLLLVVFLEIRSGFGR
ncbi:MAG: tetratricopeptide repeat protein [Planctomycetota bacterium]|jgi:Flp pilus assembly protein TadD